MAWTDDSNNGNDLEIGREVGGDAGRVASRGSGIRRESSKRDKVKQRRRRKSGMSEVDILAEDMTLAQRFGSGLLYLWLSVTLAQGQNVRRVHACNTVTQQASCFR